MAFYNMHVVVIGKGKYRRQHFTDKNVIAFFMSPDGGIACWPALIGQGLTEHLPNKVFVKNSRRRNMRSVFGMCFRFQFVTAKIEKLTTFLKTLL